MQNIQIFAFQKTKNVLLSNKMNGSYQSGCSNIAEQNMWNRWEVLQKQVRKNYQK